MNNKYLIVFITSIVLLSGCNMGLNLLPEDSISDATFWKTSADFKKATNNLYFSLEGFNYNEMDVKSDIAFFVPNAVSNGTYQITEENGGWTNAYIYIRRCNKIIERGTGGYIDETLDVKRFVAEAKFFRAYNYWQIFKLYGGVPLVIKVLELDDKELYAPRATRKETVDLILKDLTDAAADLPLKKDLKSEDIGRLTKGAANSLKARVALFEGTWEKNRGVSSSDMLQIALESATDVMNSMQYSLFTDKGDKSYRYLFIEEGDGSTECVLDRRYQRYVSSHPFGLTIQEGHLLPTKKLADMYLCTDGLPITKSSQFEGYNKFDSEFQNRDPRMKMTILIPGSLVPQAWYSNPTESWPFYPQRLANTGYTTYKYVSEDPIANGTPGTLYDYDRHLIRFAEVLLIYAEAIFEKNGFISDSDLNKSINLIRQRVGMPSLTNTFATTNGLDMREEIRCERTVELALEGFRWDDLRRWKIAETVLPNAIMGIKIIGTPWAKPILVGGQNRNPYENKSWIDKTDHNGFIITENASERSFDPIKDYLLPLPSKEILLNPELEQNPGW